MEHLKLFESFENIDIIKICKKYGIKDYTINEDGSIDAGNVSFYNRGLTNLPLKFNKVNNFSCAYNFLITLEGGPIKVNNFSCYNNKLTSLKGCPEYIVGDFYCHSNDITSFEYFPKHVGNHFSCLCNPIYHIWRLFGDYSKIELFNDMDIIQDGVVILDRLNFFLEEIGRPTVKSVGGYKNI